jgi:transposase
VSYREVPVHQVREVIRLWLAGEGIRSTARLAGVDRKTVGRYVGAAKTVGLDREGGPEQVSDEVVGLVCELVRPARKDGRGQAWVALDENRELIAAWVKAEVPLTKVQVLLARRGVQVPYRTLNRFAIERCEYGSRRATVRVADGDPGVECQVDFGRMGLVGDPVAGRRRVCQALIFTACYSRHSFVWLSFGQRLGDVIAGCEAAWSFFGGVFKVLVPDNMKPIVETADPISPRFNAGFFEYAQSRGFAIDPARVRTPTDKGRVERTVAYVRGSLFAGEEFIDLVDAQRKAQQWCVEVAGQRIHRSTGRRPGEVFAAEEAHLLLPVPVMPYDLPIYAHPKVARDCHVEIARSLYSVPHRLIGARLDARADANLVKLYYRGQLVKVHPRLSPGRRSTDIEDLPAHKAVYANRDTDWLLRQAAIDGESIGVVAARLLDVELPWTRMRQVYRLLGLVRRYGAGRVDDACAQALDVDCIDVGVVSRMLERARAGTPQPRVVAQRLPLRFARHESELGGGR